MRPFRMIPQTLWAGACTPSSAAFLPCACLLARPRCSLWRSSASLRPPPWCLPAVRRRAVHSSLRMWRAPLRPHPHSRPLLSDRYTVDNGSSLDLAMEGASDAADAVAGLHIDEAAPLETEGGDARIGPIEYGRARVVTPAGGGPEDSSYL